jgi:hypothetical protein
VSFDDEVIDSLQPWSRRVEDSLFAALDIDLEDADPALPGLVEQCSDVDGMDVRRFVGHAFADASPPLRPIAAWRIDDLEAAGTVPDTALDDAYTRAVWRKVPAKRGAVAAVGLDGNHMTERESGQKIRGAESDVRPAVDDEFSALDMIQASVFTVRKDLAEHLTITRTAPAVQGISGEFAADDEQLRRRDFFSRSLESEVDSFYRSEIAKDIEVIGESGERHGLPNGRRIMTAVLTGAIPVKRVMRLPSV